MKDVEREKLTKFINDLEDNVERLEWVIKFIKFHEEEKYIVKDGIKVLKSLLKDISKTKSEKDMKNLLKVKKIIEKYDKENTKVE